MSIIDLIVKICKFFPGISNGIVHHGLVLVYLYHLFASSAILNTNFNEAQGVEWAANAALSPVHYLCNGKEISWDGASKKFTIKQRYQYLTGKRVYSPFALTFFTPSLVVGGTLKAIALLSPEVRIRHQALQKQLKSTKVISENGHYSALGMEITDWKQGEKLLSQGYQRRPGDENVLQADKEALKEIARIFHKHEIPFWVDCGTLIGTYRYGGVIPWDNDLDLSILMPDFQNAKNALNELDPKKCVAQDWSGRDRAKTYIRVYVKESHNHIDIYTHSIDAENKTIKYFIAHLDSPFMADKWKKRELLQASPIPFETVFPLKLGLFDGIEVPVPHDVATFLTIKYGPNLNPAKIYSEETGHYEKDLTHPYWQTPLAH
ncbi:MAG: LicD family protein [Chlamydiia bacterium]|nr:LicD family protein [Chlamydiia bacterium]